jgi:hypothetical protein
MVHPTIRNINRGGQRAIKACCEIINNKRLIHQFKEDPNMYQAAVHIINSTPDSAKNNIALAGCRLIESFVLNAMPSVSKFIDTVLPAIMVCIRSNDITLADRASVTIARLISSSSNQDTNEISIAKNNNLQKISQFPGMLTAMIELADKISDCKNKNSSSELFTIVGIIHNKVSADETRIAYETLLKMLSKNPKFPLKVIGTLIIHVSGRAGHVKSIAGIPNVMKMLIDIIRIKLPHQLMHVNEKSFTDNLIISTTQLLYKIMEDEMDMQQRIDATEHHKLIEIMLTIPSHVSDIYGLHDIILHDYVYGKYVRLMYTPTYGNAAESVLRKLCTAQAWSKYFQELYPGLHKAIKSPATIDMRRCCWACGSEQSKSYSQCSVCKIACYCDEKCQLAHWKKHKPWCKK